MIGIATMNTDSLIRRLDRSADRARLEIAGKDRAAFLHNLATNEVKKLAPGTGREAFVTTIQGKTLAYIQLHVAPDSILVRTDRGSLELLLPHFQKYAIFSDITINDLQESFFEYHLLGERAFEVFSFEAPAPAEPYSIAAGRIDEISVRVIRESPTGRLGATVIGRADDRSAFLKALEQACSTRGIEPTPLDAAEFNAMRIAAGTPVSGVDVNPDNLPQELGRDQTAISFTKGCYLGQETVARLDSMGHVNKILRVVVFDVIDRPLPVGTVLLAEGKTAGTITSAEFSKEHNRVIALGYLKMNYALDGTIVTATLDGATITASVRIPPLQTAAR
jgi:folate-binding protein YgfZ